MIKAILFDFGGTLVYTDEIDKNDGYKVGKALYGYFKKHGIDLKLNPQQTYDAFVEGCKKMKKESKENNNFDLQPYDLFTK
jgi:beta-phosphoglucomutase-like phosphatase (HAD superfamily)